MDRIDLTIPQPSLLPEQVVVRQVESMRRGVRDRDQLVECYSLAAPSNRAMTGPFENFVELVQSPPYAVLGQYQEYQVGTAVVDEDVAAVLVSLLTQEDRSMAFRFILVRQTVPPNAGCWMTESVFALGTAELDIPSLNSSSSDNSSAGGDPEEQAVLQQESRID